MSSITCLLIFLIDCSVLTSSGTKMQDEPISENRVKHSQWSTQIVSSSLGHTNLEVSKELTLGTQLMVHPRLKFIISLALGVKNFNKATHKNSKHHHNVQYRKD